MIVQNYLKLWRPTRHFLAKKTFSSSNHPPHGGRFNIPVEIIGRPLCGEGGRPGVSSHAICLRMTASGIGRYLRLQTLKLSAP